MSAQDIYAAIAGVVAVGALVAFLFREGTQLAREIAKLSERVAVLEADNKTFWAVMTPHMAKIIHQDTAAERDELMDRFSGQQELTDEELTRLLEMLRDVANDESRGGGERIVASLSIARVMMEMNHRQPPAVDTTVTMRPKKRWWRR